MLSTTMGWPLRRLCRRLQAGSGSEAGAGLSGNACPNALKTKLRVSRRNAMSFMTSDVRERLRGLGREWDRIESVLVARGGHDGFFSGAEIGE
jgi:hypothetical protein